MALFNGLSVASDWLRECWEFSGPIIVQNKQNNAIPDYFPHLIDICSKAREKASDQSNRRLRLPFN